MKDKIVKSISQSIETKNAILRDEGLVELIEEGMLDSDEIKQLLKTAVAPMQTKDVDVIICDHDCERIFLQFQ